MVLTGRRDYVTSRVADVELPRQILVQHLDPARDYQINSQRARRSTVTSDGDLTIELPLVLSASDAKSTAEKIISLAWLGRVAGIYQIGIDYLHIEPGHKIVVTHDDGKQRVMRVTRRELRLPTHMVLECRNDGSPILDRRAVASASPSPSQEVSLPGPTVAHLLDIPPLRETDDDSAIYVAGSGASSGWRGAELFHSLDGGVNFDGVSDLPTGAVIGEINGKLGVAASQYWDYASSAEVTLLSASDTLESISVNRVFSGENTCLIGNEILQFQNAELIDERRYRLTNLLRGRRGTEDSIDGHESGERFVHLSARIGIIRQAIPLALIGASRIYRAVSYGTRIDDAADISLNYTARALRPFRAGSSECRAEREWRHCDFVGASSAS